MYVLKIFMIDTHKNVDHQFIFIQKFKLLEIERDKFIIYNITFCILDFFSLLILGMLSYELLIICTPNKGKKLWLITFLTLSNC